MVNETKYIMKEYPRHKYYIRTPRKEHYNKKLPKYVFRHSCATRVSYLRTSLHLSAHENSLIRPPGMVLASNINDMLAEISAYWNKKDFWRNPLEEKSCLEGVDVFVI